MGCLVALIAVFNTLSEMLFELCAGMVGRIQEAKYNHIDFDNIKQVTLCDVEVAYRTETEEEFDPVMSDFLTQQDGWQHYETQTVEYEVENGENYHFIIMYKDGKEIHRTYHESSPLTDRLLEICNRDNHT